MSFSRAKLQRFNDLQTTTPSPADYNTQVKSHVAGAVISQSDRFSKQPSPAVSESVSVASHDSSTVFRTPTLPKKKKPKKPLAEQQTNLLSSFDEVEALKEKMVECNNKDLYINELMDQFEELKLQVSVLEEQNEHLNAKEIEIKSKTDFLVREHENEIDNLTVRYNAEKLLLNDNLKKVGAELESIKQEHGLLKLQIERDFQNMLENINEYEASRELQAKQVEAMRKEQEQIWKRKLEDQEKQAEAILKECQTISEHCIIESEVEKNDVKYKLSEKIKEIDEIKSGYEKVYKTMSEKYEHLQSDFNRAMDELNSVRKNLHKQVDIHDNYVQQIVSEKHTYNITISKTHETIEALKKRLYDSDKDVEQLKAELESCEASKLTLESKCNALADTIDALKTANDDLELQNESAVKTTEEKICRVERDLRDKVEQYKEAAEETVKKVQDKLLQKTAEFEEVFKQLCQQQALNVEAQSLLERINSEDDQMKALINVMEDKLVNSFQIIKTLEAAKTDLEDELKTVKKQCEKAQMENEQIEPLTKQLKYYESKVNEYEQDVEDMNQINRNYIDQSGKYDELLQKYEALVLCNANLEKTIEEQERLIGPFREQLSAYEMERNALFDQKVNAELEARAIGLKYADLMGHQNQKQKIKYLVDLKTRNNELKENNTQLEQKVRSQAKQIEKLKIELMAPRKSPKKKTGKENVSKQNLALNTNLNSSLNMNSSPLRDRN